MFSSWVLEKLEAVKHEQNLIIEDSLRLIPDADGSVHRFANENGFTVIVASTNLVFRELYEKAANDKEIEKLLILDRAPARRRSQTSLTKAPPPFYPDFLARIPETARIKIMLRQFLIEKTGDPNWPIESNDPRFARLIIGSIEAVLKAHASLRVAHPTRFTDHDFKTIVAYSALGVPESAFKRPEAKSYWRICLFGYPALAELDSLAPEIASSIRDEIRRAPAPFLWFADSPPDSVIRAFYLSTILAQHIDHWKLVLASIDSDLKPFSDINVAILCEAAPELISIDSARAHQDLQDIEASLSKEALNLILLDQLKIFTHGRFADVIEREHYSTLIRSLSLLAALDNLLSETPQNDALKKVDNVVFSEQKDKKELFIEQRTSPVWENLKTAYRLVKNILEIRIALNDAIKKLKVRNTSELSFDWFRNLWNGQKINRLEYYISCLERLVFSADFLPRSSNDLPAAFFSASNRIRERVNWLRDDIQNSLGSLNVRYQEMVAAQYNSWISQPSSEIRLTSHFLRRCLKPNWDPQTEKAVVFVFDGMRYDIWDELVRPIFEDRMEIIKEYPASSLLPSETHISRKAIFAGTYPDKFSTRSGEDALLKDVMRTEFGYKGDVEVITPDGTGTGETVRYRAGNIDFFIFELCDKELHKIPVKILPDGRNVPGRPLAFVYQQHIKDIIDTEVMSIIRNLSSDTKVFVVADHGFNTIGRERIRVENAWLNDSNDCYYLNAWLKQNLTEVNALKKIRDSVLEFSVSDLRMPSSEDVYDRATNRNWTKKYSSIIFPRTGFALSRPKANFNPDAYSHGGISIQEMLVPMLAMRVKGPEEGLLIISPITGKIDLIEGEEAEFRMTVHLTQSHKNQEVRIESQATYQEKEDTSFLPNQIQYISTAGGEIVYRFIPNTSDASDDERKLGLMERSLKISINYREGQRTVRKARTMKFSVRLNSEKIVRRVPAHLGKILGLTPRSMK
ncbi:MAG: PglZ domain-containing protein [Dehalococcoides mccartyi]|uniref:PglZ domain-containing protein n=1 Tax=Dehalococcoides mccartyi TaxID=61435 RepID=UPI00242F4946|nr:PglZ domain-containing protein [Dehalococcoides mccartyi]MCF7634651.1 PglZ domain-containing protein [Dehalococcoides mccartyi]